MDYRNFEAIQPTIHGNEATIKSLGNINTAHYCENPDFMFVGERAERARDRWSIMGSDEAYELLYYSLMGAGIKEDRYCVTVAEKTWLATEDERHMMLKLEIEVLKPKLVVALGRRAEKMLLKVKDISSGVRWFEVLPHPSFWRTYYRDHLKEYETLLKGLDRKIHPTQVI